MKNSRARDVTYQRVRRAVLAGQLTRSPCEVCGDDAVEAHHDDYSKPLEVRWLCKKHHRLHHNQYGPAPEPQSPEGASRYGGRDSDARSGTLSVTLKARVRETMRKELQVIAERDDRSVGAVVRRALRELLERENGKEAR